MPTALSLALLLTTAQLQRDPFAALAPQVTRAGTTATATCDFLVSAIVEDADETVALGVVPTAGAACTPQLLRVGDTVTPHFGRVARIDAEGLEVVTEYLTHDGELKVERVRLPIGQTVPW